MGIDVSKEYAASIISVEEPTLNSLRLENVRSHCIKWVMFVIFFSAMKFSQLHKLMLCCMVGCV
jgi:hypothetical protein